jgi:hypothetical protein
LKTRHAEATSGAAPHAPREEARGGLRPCKGRMKTRKRRGRRRNLSRGRSGLHTVRSGGQPAQDVVRVSDMYGKRNISTIGGQQLAHMHPLRGGCMPCQFCQKAVAWPPRAPNSVTTEGMKRMSGQLLTPPISFQTWSSQHGLERLRETGASSDAEKPGNHDIKSKFRASDAVVARDTQKCRSLVHMWYVAT